MVARETEHAWANGQRLAFVKAEAEHFDNRAWFAPAVEEAKTPPGMGSWLAMAGATTRELLEAAGHKTMSQVARYAHLSPQHTQSVVDRIAGTGADRANMH